MTTPPPQVSSRRSHARQRIVMQAANSLFSACRSGAKAQADRPDRRALVQDRPAAVSSTDWLLDVGPTVDVQPLYVTTTIARAEQTCRVGACIRLVQGLRPCPPAGRRRTVRSGQILSRRRDQSAGARYARLNQNVGNATLSPALSTLRRRNKARAAVCTLP